jgi:phosphocarrier protein HPr
MTAACTDQPLVRDMAIINKRGLHARASARFVKCAERFDATVLVSRDQMSVGGTSIMGLMMLAASPGSVIQVSIEGPQAAVAMAALAALVESGFGETD